MKKLIFLFLSVIAAGSLFQACDNSKTYAEMLEDEKNAVNKFIKDSAINVISLEEFERDTITDLSRNEYVAFPNSGFVCCHQNCADNCRTTLGIGKYDLLKPN